MLPFIPLIPWYLLFWFVPSLYFYMQLPVVIDLTEIPADLPYLLGMSLLLAAIA